MSRGFKWTVGALIIATCAGFITISYSDLEKYILERHEFSAEAILPVPLKPKIPEHIRTPDSVKAIYMTSCAATTESFRKSLIALIEETEINSIVIDVKDYTGKISFASEKLEYNTRPYKGCFVPDMKEFLETLHAKGIYIIARITVFQDTIVPLLEPEIAVKKLSNKEEAWKDRKGITYIDPGAQKMWEYISNVGEEAYAIGFDEINFDYIRFPSDGNMADMYLPISSGKLKKEVMRSFFEYLNKRFGDQKIPISADIFGMTTTNTDDLNIGQILEDALVNFDYVAPMVYPSHYPATWNGYPNPAQKPYETIHYSMQRAVERARAASTTPFKLRPWLQDFSINGVKYTPDMVRAQIEATYAVGLDSFMLWDPSNRYSRSALENEVVQKNANNNEENQLKIEENVSAGI